MPTSLSSAGGTGRGNGVSRRWVLACVLAIVASVVAVRLPVLAGAGAIAASRTRRPGGGRLACADLFGCGSRLEDALSHQEAERAEGDAQDEGDDRHGAEVQ